jgi:hypothetical protein
LQAYGGNGMSLLMIWVSVLGKVLEVKVQFSYKDFFFRVTLLIIFLKNLIFLDFKLLIFIFIC